MEDVEDVEDLVAEIVCIYKKIRQGRDYRTFKFKTYSAPKDNLRTAKIENSFDFNKHKLDGKKLLFYSDETGLKQSNELTEVIPPSLSQDGFFWLNIFDPNDEDIKFLSSTFQVHETTLAEIRERNSPEKFDIYRNYAFISLKMLANNRLTEDINFNVLIFDNFVITLHNKRWQGVGNIMNFCYVISRVTTLNPCWVFFSIITEFHQDVMYSLDEIEKHSSSIISNHNVKELHSNFCFLQKVFIFKQYLRPKIKMLRKFFRTDFCSGVSKKMLKGCVKDFEDIYSVLGEFKRTFERNQDMILGLRDIELAEQSNQMNLIMNRISQVTFFFLPIQCVAGIWGMNVKVPWQDDNSLWVFWTLVLVGPIFCSLFFFLSENTKKLKKKVTKSSTNI